MTITFTTRHTRKPRTYEFQIIDGWSNLTWKQAILLADLTSRLNQTDAIIRFFLKINNLHVVRIKRISQDVEGYKFESTVLRYKLQRFVISDLDMTDIVKKHSWIYADQPAPDPNIKSSNILPKLKGLLPPADALTSLNYEQYTIADAHFQRFISKHETRFLDKLIATLYTTDGTFNADDIDNNIRAVRSLSFAEKTVILWYYLSCRKFLSEVFVNLFQTGDASEETKSDPMLAWMKLTAGMIDTPADISVTKKQLVWDVFSYIDEKIRAYNETKLKLNNGK